MNADADTRTVRDQHCDGLQALVDLLRAHPELESPFTALAINAPVDHCDDAKAQLAGWARATSHLKPAKSYEKHGDWASLTIRFGPGVEVFVYASREKVCERVVTGVETVTKTVKDPEALAAVPEIEVTETVETIEWRCEPLLAVQS